MVSEETIKLLCCPICKGELKSYLNSGKAGETKESMFCRLNLRISFNFFLLELLLITLLSSCLSGKREKEIGLNQNIHHDDFEYAVTDFEKTNLIVSGGDTIRTTGNFYLVHFRVMNKALRVNHQWDNSIGFIVDEKGNRYENNKNLQVLLEKSSPFGWKERYITPHGQTDSTILIFEIPPAIQSPFLMVRGGILMGDVFDAGKFLKTKVRLF